MAVASHNKQNKHQLPSDYKLSHEPRIAGHSDALDSHRCLPFDLISSARWLIARSRRDSFRKSRSVEIRLGRQANVAATFGLLRPQDRHLHRDGELPDHDPAGACMKWA